MNPTTDGAFARTAFELYEAGWQPIPLTDDKRPAVRNRTGYGRQAWTVDELAEAVVRYRRNDVGIVMPDGYIAIDVDYYDGKQGAVTVARLIETFGELPPTWHLRAEGRPKQSARFLYRVPVGRYSERLFSFAGGDVELVQPHHRHSVSAGTVHRSAGIVRWYGPDCRPVDETYPPTVDVIPFLPEAWTEALADRRRLRPVASTA